jgi:hypothetical protein
LRLTCDSSDKPKQFRSLRGFLDGDEPDEPSYFKFSATLRIHGEQLSFAEIEQALGVVATHRHRKGERRGPRSPAYKDDAWHYQSPTPEAAPLANHLDELWRVVKPAANYLKELKQRCQIDVFCGYRSNCDTAGFEVPHTSLELFAALEIPFGVSVVIV